MNSVDTYSGLNSDSVKRGEAKWILYPLGVKVRIIMPEDDEIDDFDYPVQNDYAGIESLKVMLSDLNYASINLEDKIEWKVEYLDPDWKSEHLEHLKDFYGNPDDYESWFCGVESYESADEKDDYCMRMFDENSGISQDSPFDVKKVVEEFCRSTGRGSAIPLFLAEYHKDVKWIESHLVHTVEVKSKRGTNPNSLKNLKQNRKKEEMKNAEEI